MSVQDDIEGYVGALVDELLREEASPRVVLERDAGALARGVVRARVTLSPKHSAIIRDRLARELGRP